MLIGLLGRVNELTHVEHLEEGLEQTKCYRSPAVVTTRDVSASLPSSSSPSSPPPPPLPSLLSGPGGRADSSGYRNLVRLRAVHIALEF